VVHAVLGGVAGDPPKDRQASLDRLVDGGEVGALQVRQDAVPRGGETDEVSTDVAIGPERQVDSIAEADRHPEFAKILHENAFAGAERALEAYLVRQIEGGKLKPHDTAAWAHALVGLATNLELVQALLGVPSGRDSHGDRARKQLVVMYVRAHALDGSG